MRLLIATPLFPPDIGGPATYSNLLKKELPRHGIEAEILSFGKVRRSPKPLRHILYFLKVLYHGRRANVIFALDPVSVGFPAFLASKFLRKPLIIKVVGDYAWEQFQVKNENEKFVTPEEFQRQQFGFLTEVRRWVEHRVALSARKVIVPSKYLKRIVKQWGVSEKNIAVIYNAFDPARTNAGLSSAASNGVGLPEIQKGKEALRTELGFSGTVLVSAARLVLWKGFGVLIDVVAKLKEEIPDLSFYIVGEGPDKKKLESRISNLGLQNTVILAGKLSRSEVLQYLKAADIFVLNTGYEGFSHQLLEAMSVGIPVITTPVGGNPELVEDGKTGELIPYDDKDALRDAIRKLVKNEDYSHKLSENAKQQISAFSTDRMLGETVNLLKTL